MKGHWEIDSYKDEWKRNLFLNHTEHLNLNFSNCFGSISDIRWVVPTEICTCYIGQILPQRSDDLFFMDSTHFLTINTRILLQPLKSSGADYPNFVPVKVQLLQTIGFYFVLFCIYFYFYFFKNWKNVLVLYNHLALSSELSISTGTDVKHHCSDDISSNIIWRMFCSASVSFIKP